MSLINPYPCSDRQVLTDAFWSRVHKKILRAPKQHAKNQRAGQKRNMCQDFNSDFLRRNFAATVRR